MRNLTRLPEAELKVMLAIWQLNIPARTGEIRCKLEEKRDWNLSALQTLLSRLVGRGFLLVEKNGQQRSYTPLVEEAEYLAFENSLYLTGRHGILPNLVASLYESNSLTRQDIEELRNFLNETLKEEKNE